MGEDGVKGSCSVQSECGEDNFYPIFGVSCAFSALGLISEHDVNDSKWSEFSNSLLKGSARLEGLLVWRVQREQAKKGKGELFIKLENAEREIEDLKKQRREAMQRFETQLLSSFQL